MAKISVDEIVKISVDKGVLIMMALATVDDEEEFVEIKIRGNLDALDFSNIECGFRITSNTPMEIRFIKSGYIKAELEMSRKEAIEKSDAGLCDFALFTDSELK